MKSLKSLPFSMLVLAGCFAFMVTLLISCRPGNGVLIPVPRDTSALGRINHFISRSELEQFKKDYIPERDSLSRVRPGLFIPLMEAFNKEALIQILKDPKNVGIRIYYGIKKGDMSKQVRLILVGVDEQGRDLYIIKGSPAAAQAGGGGEGGLEYGQCPPCDSIQ